MSRDSRLSELWVSPPSQGSRSFSLCSPLILPLTAASVKLSVTSKRIHVVRTAYSHGHTTSQYSNNAAVFWYLRNCKTVYKIWELMTKSRSTRFRSSYADFNLEMAVFHKTGNDPSCWTVVRLFLSYWQEILLYVRQLWKSVINGFFFIKNITCVCSAYIFSNLQLILLQLGNILLIHEHSKSWRWQQKHLIRVLHLSNQTTLTWPRLIHSFVVLKKKDDNCFVPSLLVIQSQGDRITVYTERKGTKIQTSNLTFLQKFELWLELTLR